MTAHYHEIATPATTHRLLSDVPALHSARQINSSRRKRTGGLLVVVVATLYVGSGVVVQLLFDELKFEKPFFFSFTSVALCSTYLLLHCRQKCMMHELQQEMHPIQQISITNRPMLLVRPALLLTPAYFGLNYTYFLSLDLTSVSETMILSSSTGVWALIFSCILLNEPMTRARVATVMVSLLGMCLITYNPSEVPPPAHRMTGAAVAQTNGVESALTGDLLAVMSAMVSGVYMVLLRAVVPDEEQVHMPSLFGMVGAISALCFLPLFPILHYAGVEVGAATPSPQHARFPVACGPSSSTFIWLCGLGTQTFELPPTSRATLSMLFSAATSTVLPDMLLAKAVVMTSPLIATLGLSLMIPLSVLTDVCRGVAHLTPGFIVGTVAVFVGFIMEVHADTQKEKRIS